MKRNQLLQKNVNCNSLCLNPNTIFFRQIIKNGVTVEFTSQLFLFYNISNGRSMSSQKSANFEAVRPIQQRQ